VSEESPVQNFITSQLQGLLGNAARATGLPEKVCMRAVSEIMRSEGYDPPVAARVFVTRVAGARRRGRHVILLNGGDAVLCVRCGALTRNLTDAAKFRCARCHAFRGDVVDPDDGRAA